MYTQKKYLPDICGKDRDLNGTNLINLNKGQIRGACSKVPQGGRKNVVWFEVYYIHDQSDSEVSALSCSSPSEDEAE